jgi:peptidoglycan/LPS O-acetylase OafA/YrhL
MFSHAFLIATGSETKEPFARLLVTGNTLGLYSVFTFFIISGFLLARSLRSHPGAIAYAVNRTLRILPAFALCTLVTVLIIGPICSSAGLASYFSSWETRSFVTESLNTFGGDLTLPGVFAYDGALATVINGSLWSLRYEALSYVFLLVVWTACRSTTLATAVTIVVACLTLTVPAVANAATGIAYTLPYFAGGVLMQWVHSRWGTTRVWAVVCGVLLLASSFFGWDGYAFALFGAYIVVFLGERENLASWVADQVGDCSYGLYLYGWPCEQIVKQLSGTSSPFWMLVGAVPLAAALALISCHLIERPAMTWRATVTARVRLAYASVLRDAPGAAAAGAKIALVVGGTLILWRGQWWLFLESMGELVLAMIAASVVARVAHRLAVGT